MNDDLSLLLNSYEPELHPGATYRWKEKKAVFKIYQTGSVSITAPSVANIDAAVQHIFPLVHEHQKEKPMDNINHAHMKAARRKREETKAGRGLWGNNRKRLKTSHGRISLEDDDADLDDFIHDEDHDDDESSIEDEEEAISIHDEDEASSDDDDDDE
jgi:transcription initiation factor TFIID TATA-box-binding protein